MRSELSELREIVSLTERYLRQLIGDGFQMVYFKGNATTGEQTDTEEALAKLEKEVSDCRKCGLWKTRMKTVFGAGAPRAKLLFLGEAPGAEEDRQGIPFVGRAGELFTRMLAAIGLKRSDVYITNVLKCRPPNNRDPLGCEVACCEPYLLAQLEFIRPALICALGRHAAQTLLKTTQGINKLRGRFHDYCGIKVLPTYHPAYLLRNPEGKKNAWEDLKRVRDFLKTIHGN